MPGTISNILYHLSVDMQTLYCPYFPQLIGHFLRIMSLVVYTGQTEPSLFTDPSFAAPKRAYCRIDTLVSKYLHENPGENS